MNKVKEAIELYNKIADLLPDGNVNMTVHRVKEKDIPTGVNFDGILEDCNDCKVYSKKNKYSVYNGITFFIDNKEEI